MRLTAIVKSDGFDSIYHVHWIWIVFITCCILLQLIYHLACDSINPYYHILSVVITYMFMAVSCEPLIFFNVIEYIKKFHSFVSLLIRRFIRALIAYRTLRGNWVVHISPAPLSTCHLMYMRMTASYINWYIPL